jgi:hypothetical protein
VVDRISGESFQKLSQKVVGDELEKTSNPATASELHLARYNLVLFLPRCGLSL